MKHQLLLPYKNSSYVYTNTIPPPSIVPYDIEYLVVTATEVGIYAIEPFTRREHTLALLNKDGTLRDTTSAIVTLKPDTRYQRGVIICVECELCGKSREMEYSLTEKLSSFDLDRFSEFWGRKISREFVDEDCYHARRLDIKAEIMKQYKEIYP